MPQIDVNRSFTVTVAGASKVSSVEHGYNKPTIRLKIPCDCFIEIKNDDSNDPITTSMGIAKFHMNGSTIVWDSIPVNSEYDITNSFNAGHYGFYAHKDDIVFAKGRAVTGTWAAAANSQRLITLYPIINGQGTLPAQTVANQNSIATAIVVYNSTSTWLKQTYSTTKNAWIFDTGGTLYQNPLWYSNPNAELTPVS